MKEQRLLVDGLNVIGSRGDGWWRDREGAMRALVSKLDAYARKTSERLTVVLDANPFEVAGAGTEVRVVFASPPVRDAADDEIVRLLETDPAPGSVQVVTSDSALAARVKALGATVLAAGRFRDRLDELEEV
jgi:predicted RNA-binding protein with PIN domain